MTSLAESTKLVMTTDYAHEASVLQLMKSPYNETMALLTASAATEAGLQNLMARLSTEKNRRVHSADAKRGKAVVRGCYRAES